MTFTTKNTCECRRCGWEGPMDLLDPPLWDLKEHDDRALLMSLTVGQDLPAGECPQCQSLCWFMVKFPVEVVE